MSGPRPADLTGREFRRADGSVGLTVLAPAPARRTRGGASRARWRCLCACGSETVVDAHSLVSAQKPTRSCGCLHAEALRNRWRAIAFDWTAERLSLLGTMPDAELAARLGLCRDTVRTKRAAMKIPAHRTLLRLRKENDE